MAHQEEIEEEQQQEQQQDDEKLDNNNKDDKANEDDETKFKFLKEKLSDEAMKLPDMNIVVSGLAGRFPKSNSINEFEENLYNGIDMVNDNDNSRFTCKLWGLPPRAGRLKELNRFDNEFFGFNYDEANYIDFQLRILYEVVYESILDAGLNPANLRGSKTGVFFGLHCNEFENALADDPQFKSNGYYGQFAIKIAQYFDFKGLTITFDAACASGFVGLHNGVQALNDGLIDQAIVCSSNIPIHPTGSFIFLQMQMLSPTGYSRFLDSRADGYVKSEAVVSVLLQKKDLAFRNYGSIMATMTSVDGYKPEGITFPSDKSQERLIRSTKELANISINHIEYLEAHGTGTPAGDPQEASAIANVYYPNFVDDNNDDDENFKRRRRDEKRIVGPLLVGSVKTNMGHSEAASGLCALAKVTLMLENEIIYKGLHFDQPNNNIESLKANKLKFVDETCKLNSKIIPLSCYGFGGSNVHAIVRANEKPAIEENKFDFKIEKFFNNNNNNNNNDVIAQQQQQQQENNYRLIVMFGRDEQLLNEFFDNLKEKHNRNTRNCLNENFLFLLDQLSVNRIDRLMNYRGVMIIKRNLINGNFEEIFRQISDCKFEKLSIINKNDNEGKINNHFQDCKQREVNLILPGLGCQWPGMARGLKLFKPFWSTIERLAPLLEPFEINLLDLLTNDNNHEILSMSEKFVSIIAYQIALINIIKLQLKVNNLKNIIGHSLGEISAAYAAGLFNERETLMVAYQIGKTLDLNKHLIINGKMVALMGINEFQAEELILKNNFKTIKVCCINGDDSITISGSIEEIDLICENVLDKNRIFIKEIESNLIPLHNDKLMNENNFKEKLKENLLKILFPLASYNRENLNWHSSIELEDEFLLKEANANYFAECICNKVNFSKQLNKLINNNNKSSIEDDQSAIFIELSPNGIFEAQFKQQLKNKKNFYYLKMMKNFSNLNLTNSEQELFLLKSIGQLYLFGSTFNLTNLYHFKYNNNNNNNQLFPVKRQTPSLSSIFKWLHKNDLFVPRYPIHFSKSSAKCEIPVDIVQDRDKYLVGHCIEGRILFPATGYLFLIWRVFSFTKRKIYDACFQSVENELCPIEFYNVRLLRAVILGNRSVQIYIHYEEGSGKFEIKEGGSVVVEGYARSPIENPDGLLYDNIRDKIKDENLELTMNEDDIYKQFRVSGYDYGETFRNVKLASSDGRLSKVKFNGHFVALTDSILQSIFLAVSQYAPSGGLFLPTKFDYVRFQPKIILDKLRKVGALLDLSEKALNTEEKREIMTKIMQREGAPVAGVAEAKAQQPAAAAEAAEANSVEANTISGSVDNGIKSVDKDDEKEKEKEKEKELEKPKVPDCYFETYCDPITGIIVTDGIEMKGIKAMPAPRRQDNNSVLLESYQFIKDFEEPLEDERLTNYKSINLPYIRVCNSLSIKLLEQLCGPNSIDGFKEQQLKEKKVDCLNQMLINHNDKFIESYKNKHLKSIYKVKEVVRGGLEEEEEEIEVKEEELIDKEKEMKQPEEEEIKEKKRKKEKENEDYDIRKNGNYMLLSVLDQLLKEEVTSQRQVKNVIQSNRLHLMKDLIQNPFQCERFMRPILEVIIENICFKKMKLKILEINLDDGLVKDSMNQLIQNIEPKMSLDYSLAHPNIERLHELKLISSSAAVATSNNNNNNNNGGKSNNNNNLNAKTFTLKNNNLQLLFSEQQFSDLDLIIYKDISCYSLPKQVIEQNGLLPVLVSLNNNVKLNGFVLIIMRKELTLAERILLSLSEPELIGVTKKDLKELGNLNRKISNKIEHINSILKARYELMLSEAKRNKMLFISKKTDKSGCTMLLFKSTIKSESSTNKQSEQQQQQQNAKQTNKINEEEIESDLDERVLLQVRHDNCEVISSWLDELKKEFTKPKEKEKEEKEDEKNKENSNEGEGESKEKDLDYIKSLKEGEDNNDNKIVEQKVEKVEKLSNKQIWLCAIATKDQPISGLIGMMRALIKELGSTRLRCYFDNYTFKNKSNPIDNNEIENCEFFKLSLKRNLLWNCIDSDGNFGSYRHLTINNFMSNENCLCENVPLLSLEEEDNNNSLLINNDEAEAEAEDDQHKQLIKGAYVNNATSGDLSSFTWYEAPFKYLTNEEIENDLVKVSYSALNFRDVMLATGRLPLDAIPIRLATSDCLLGLEFSGYNKQNKRVMGMVFGRGIATHVLCPQKSSIKLEIPDNLSLKEAATIPVVYATAIMALIYRGKMKTGESILIHAGSGGVGQAAIRLASYYKLKIFTTVGSEEKRKFLLEEFPDSLKDENIFSSRNCEFEDKIMSLTYGRGVDLILNSLADDKLQASVRCLANGGRFLEIGKYDMSMDTKFELLKLEQNKTFHGILLDKLFDTDDIGENFLNQLRLVLETLKDGLKMGYVKPIKFTLFKRDKIEDAIRFMATGKHIGKVLIEIDDNDNNDNALLDISKEFRFKCMPRFQLSPKKSYIITGGLGGFGMELIKWLVNNGARYLIITSRNGIKTGYQRTTLNRLLDAFKIKFKIITYDTTIEDGCELLLDEAIDFSPINQIGGLFHLAMVLKDTLLENMSTEDFNLVCRPKVNTFYYLDYLSKEKNINFDYFVAFSSITSGKGNAGQANYAYANSCLERICELRRLNGQHGLAIQWGAIGDVGVAYENLGGNDVVIGGTKPQRMPSCLTTLSRLLCSPFSTCLSVVPINRGHDGVGDKTDLVGAIMHVLGIKDPSKVSEQATLGELGLDSLMAVEIRQYIEREYDMTLNIQEIRSLTIAKIREIGENNNNNSTSTSNRTANKIDNNKDENNIKEAQSYGKNVNEKSKKLDLDNKEKVEEEEKKIINNNNNNKLSQEEKRIDIERIINERKKATIEGLVDKSLITSFVPQLELPKADYNRLNYKHLMIANKNNNNNKKKLINGNENLNTILDQNNSNWPIFFIPPIHGEFHKLEIISSTIKRPCIGLNWTKRLGNVNSINEAADEYLKLLKNFNWKKEFCLPLINNQNVNERDENEIKVVDLVGYSYGATIAFEMMTKLHREYNLYIKKNNNKSLLKTKTNQLISVEKIPQLRPGKLILLDGSPKQIELGSQYVTTLTINKPLTFSERLDQLILVYFISHTKRRNVNYFEFQKELSKIDLKEKKILFASKRLIELLELKKSKTSEGSDENNSTTSEESDLDCSSLENDDDNDENKKKFKNICLAMDAFCKRYDLISNYKSNSILPSDCTLIRAEKSFIKNQLDDKKETYNEDLNLSSVVQGKVELFIMKGDHETFLNINHREIGEIISNKCNN